MNEIVLPAVRYVAMSWDTGKIIKLKVQFSPFITEWGPFIRPNKKISVCRVTGLKILGRASTRTVKPV